MILASLLTAESLEENPFILKLTSALLVLFIGFIAGRLIGLILKRILHQFNVDQHLFSTIGYRLSLERQLSTLLSIIIYAIAIIIALNIIGILRYAIIILGGAFALFIIISLFLAGKDAIPNLIVGLSSSYRKKGRPGDTLRIRGIRGEIIKKGLFITLVREGEDELRIPNRLFSKEEYKVTKKKSRKKK